MINRNNLHKLNLALLLCFLQVAGISVFAQEPVLDADSTIQVKDYVSPVLLDSLANDSLLLDSTFVSVADSLQRVNTTNIQELEEVSALTDDPEITLLTADSVVAFPEKKVWIPNSGRATWLAVVFPGGGQIYNRKYWKLPIIYGGFVGCAYALSWNNKTYKDYSQAYLDIMDGDPTTNSYYDHLGPNTTIDEATDTTWGPIFKKRKDRFRRYRDMSIFAFIGVYLISIIDAYVDAELSNFDIGPDLSMRIEPAVITDQKFSGTSSIGVQCVFRF